MDTNYIFQLIKVIFGGIMVFFYLGFGLFIIFSQLLNQYDKFIRIFFGSAFILFGLNRALITYEKARELYFTKHNADE